MSSNIQRNTIVAASILACAIGSSSAMEVVLQTVEEPHFVDQPVLLRVTVSDIDGSGKPECKHIGYLPDGVILNLAGVTTRGASVISINGRVFQQGSSAYQFDFHLTARDPGKITVGPFQVTQGKETKTTGLIDYNFQDVDTDPDMLIRLVIPDEKIYVGQRVPIKIEWGYANNTESVTELRIRSPLFDQFKFEDEPVGRQQTMVIQTAEGDQPVHYDVTRDRIDGRDYIVATMKRTLIADQPGKFEFAPITASINKVTRWRRGGGFFSTGPTPAETVPMRAEGEPLTLEISPLPPDAPESFAGAVGSGFRLDANILGSTIVNVGDPIKLKLVVQGKGNLEQAGLPRLFAEGGLDPAKFRIPDDEISGRLTEGGKEFIANIRVTDISVNQIPALAYSWFDPTQEQYMTTRSEPRSLTVGQAQIVSAKSVVTAAKTDDDANEPEPTPTAVPTTASESQAGIDLAIEVNRDKLLTARPISNPYLSSFVYLLGLAIVLMGFVANQRRQVDPAVTRRRKGLQNAITKIRNANVSPPRIFAAEVATSLRSVLPEADSHERSKIEGLLAKLDTVVYAPENQNSALLENDIRESSIGLVEGIIQKL